MLDTNLDVEKLKKLQFKIMKDVAASAVNTTYANR